MKRSDRMKREATVVALQGFCWSATGVVWVLWAAAVGISNGFWAVMFAAAVTVPALERMMLAVRIYRASVEERKWEGEAQ